MRYPTWMDLSSHCIVVLQLVLDGLQKWQHIHASTEKKICTRETREREPITNVWWSKCWYCHCHYLAFYYSAVCYSVTWAVAHSHVRQLNRIRLFDVYRTLLLLRPCLTVFRSHSLSLSLYHRHGTQIVLLAKALKAMALGGSTLMLLLFNAAFISVVAVILWYCIHFVRRRFLTLERVCTIDDRPVYKCVCVCVRIYDSILFCFKVPKFFIVVMCFGFVFFFCCVHTKFILLSLLHGGFCFAHFFLVIMLSLFGIHSPIRSFARAQSVGSLIQFIFLCSNAQITGVHKAITIVFTGFNAIIVSSIYYCS